MTKAIFPEWRVRGPTATLRLLEITTLSFVTSLVLAVLVGYFLLVAGPNGFQAYWSDPILEAVLAGIAAIAFGLGWYRGAYRRTPPTSLPPSPGRSAGRGRRSKNWTGCAARNGGYATSSGEQGRGPPTQPVSGPSSSGSNPKRRNCGPEGRRNMAPKGGEGSGEVQGGPRPAGRASPDGR